MKVSVVRNRFHEDKIFKGKLDQVNALIKTPIPMAGRKPNRKMAISLISNKLLKALISFRSHNHSWDSSDAIIKAEINHDH
jgi:hypothetical protein